MVALAHNGTSPRVVALILLTTVACGTGLTPENEAAGVGTSAAGASSIVGQTGQPAAETPVAGRGTTLLSRSSPAAAVPAQGALYLAGAGGTSAVGTAGVGGGSGGPGPRLAFDAWFEGDLIVIDATGPASSDLFMQGCSSPWHLYQQGDQGPVQVKDDRPPASGHAGYYLDAAYIPPTAASGTCDATECVSFPSGKIEVAETYEYLGVGTKAAPPDANGLSQQVPNIERRPLSGPISVGVTYFEDSACQVPSGSGAGLELPMPSEGVCCPIGLAQCSSAGPGGGWAPTIDQCAAFSQESDARSEQRVDPRGCPELVVNHNVGCDGDA